MAAVDGTSNRTITESLLPKRLDGPVFLGTKILSSLAFSKICCRMSLIHDGQAFLSEFGVESLF